GPAGVHRRPRRERALRGVGAAAAERRAAGAAPGPRFALPPGRDQRRRARRGGRAHAGAARPAGRGGRPLGRRIRRGHHPPRRVAVLSVHTSPLEQPGTGDAGGMNVYIVQTATRMARRGVAVEVFTRATSSETPPVVELAPGVLVRHVVAGPFEGLDKNELP